MFESLKKKLSRTSDKLEEEIIEEAKQEDNLQEEEGKKRSFFSFGRKKKEDKVDESKLIESGEEGADEEPKEKKSHFWSRSKGDDSDEEESVDDGDEEESIEVESPVVDEEPKEKKSRFWSRSKKDDSDEDESEDEISEEKNEEKTKEKSHFWSRNKNKDDDSSEGKGGLFSFVREKTISEKHVEDTLWELEMGLLEGDVAMEVATEVVDSVKDDLVGRKIKRSSDITEYTYDALRNAVAEIIDVPGKSMTEMIEEKKAQGEPLVVMFVGINGTGKTTTIGKLANYYLKKGYTPVIAASDTFRAGAIEQVTHHADNVGVKIIKHQKGSDPAAVAYDAVEHAKAQGKELVLIGNDATQQAVKFNEAIDIDGVILTKADADSKGGASLSIGYVIKKPIMFLGVGQGYDDIKEYDAEWMLNQLFSEDEVEIEG